MNASAQPPPPSAYLLDNAEPPATRRLRALCETYDAGTIHHLEQLGVRAGWSCLEVGGGCGTIATWLAERVGPAGRVLATDIDPRHLRATEHPNLQVQRHDIVRDPLPENAFDLIHTRLVLLHLPEREAVLERLVAALKPGGWLMDEALDYSVLPDPVRFADETLLPTHRAMLHLMDQRGIDRDWGRRLFGRLRAAGLVEVRSEGRSFMWPAGASGLGIIRGNYHQLRDALLATGLITEADWHRDVAALDAPDFVMPSPVMWAAWGRRPVAAEISGSPPE